MYKLYKFIFMWVFFSLIVSCNDERDGKDKKAKWEAKGDATIEVFKDSPIIFDTEAVPNGYNKPDANGLIRLANGRLVLKKVELPAYERDVNIKLKVRLVSKGDPFDRSGSIFILSPKKKGVTPMDIAKDRKYPEMQGELGKYPGIIRLEDYEPCVEAMRFIAPFGVGHFSQGYESQLPLPEGIDAWEKDVKWECDISHLYFLLEGGAYIGAWIDTWMKEGFEIDANLEITESKENAPMKKYNILPLMNTVNYIGQNYADVFYYVGSYGINVKTELNVQEISEATLYYTTTGHGGYDGGDEFSQRENIISCNGTQLKAWVPWIDECKPYRKWNPTSGWISHLNETSSNLARSNWCPGSVVLPEKITIDKSSIDFSKEDSFVFNFAIPNANQAMKDKLNFWLVSSYLVYR